MKRILIRIYIFENLEDTTLLDHFLSITINYQSDYTYTNYTRSL